MTGILEQSSGVVKLDNSSGTLTDISAQVKDLDISYQVQSGEYYTLGTDYGYAIVGKANFKVKMTVYHTDGASDAQKLIMDWATGSVTARRAARSLQVDTPDGTVGNRRVAGEFKLGNAGSFVMLNAASNEPGTMSVELNGEGTVTVSTIAS